MYKLSKDHTFTIKEEERDSVGGLLKPNLAPTVSRTTTSRDVDGDVKLGSRISMTLSTVLPVRERSATSLTSASSLKESLCETEYECLELNPLNYKNSTFPSLLPQLGIANSKQRRRRRQSTSQTVPVSPRSKTDDSYDSYNFGEELRRKNESRWLRIQAVAKESIDRYDRYFEEIINKTRRQRQEIRRRSREQLEQLRIEQEMKKEVQLYNSSHGRIWRHHRSMQRRALQLQAMNSQQKVGFYKFQQPPATVR